MNTVIIYDVVNNRRRTRLHTYLKELGIRSQRSVFECRLDRRELREIRNYCRQNLDLEEDRVRIYRVCSSCMNSSLVLGRGVQFSQLDWCII